MGKIKKKTSRVNDCWNTIGVWSSAEKKCDKLVEFIHCRNCNIFSELGLSVLDKSAPAGYLTQWRNDIAAAPEINKAKLNSIIVFRVLQEWFALPAVILSEVANERLIHRIPRNINKYITGIANINGEIKVCYSLKHLAGLRDDKLDKNNMVNRSPKRLIVIELNMTTYVFQVEEVSGIHWYSETDLLPVPSTLYFENAEILLGSVKQKGRQVAIFCADKFQQKLEKVSL